MIAPSTKIYGTTAGSFYDDVDTLPKATTMTGTISSSGIRVTGVGTLFTTQLDVGDYIYSDAILQRVVSIESDTILITDAAFSPALAADTYKATRANFRMVRIQNVGGANGLVNGETLYDGAEILIPDHMAYGIKSRIEPFYYDATGTVFAFTTI